MGCDGWLEQEEVERISGLKSIELPARLTLGTVQRLHQVGLTPAPAMDLRYVRLPVGSGLRRAARGGLAPGSSTTPTALRVLLDQRKGRHAVAGRRIARKEATITAAGAAGPRSPSSAPPPSSAAPAAATAAPDAPGRR